MAHDILFAIWFLLPAACANAAPVFSAVIPGLKRWNSRMDFGRQFRGKPIFGAHKTWRGLFSGMLIAGIIFSLQHAVATHFKWNSLNVQGLSYQHLPFLLGPLFGLGALGGDAVESFFKRQRGTASGERWLFFDQLDYILGAILVSLFFVRLSFVEYAWICLIWFVLHLLASYIGWLSGLKSKPI